MNISQLTIHHSQLTALPGGENIIEIEALADSLPSETPRMREKIKDILKYLGIYHPLQSFYRNMLFTHRLIQNRKKYSIYKGSGFTCNICHERYKKFVPDYPQQKNRLAIELNKVVAGYGENIFCPNCMGTARERLVIAKLSGFELKEKNILHLSPEKNIYHFIKSQAHVITADLLPGFYKTVDDLAQKQDATHFSFDNESFDWVIGNHILEHIPEDEKAMKEIYRVLKKGGRAVLQVPYSEQLDTTVESPTLQDPAKRAYLFGQKDHVRIYSLDDYVHRLQRAGFEVEIIPYTALEKYYLFAIQQDECFINIMKPLSV